MIVVPSALRQLNQTYIDGLGIRYLPRWKDPWGMRPMTFGEVGCFLSHYSIWQQVRRIGLSSEAWLVLVRGNRYRGHGGSALMGGVVSPRGITE